MWKEVRKPIRKTGGRSERASVLKVGWISRRWKAGGGRCRGRRGESWELCFVNGGMLNINQSHSLYVILWLKLGEWSVVLCQVAAKDELEKERRFDVVENILVFCVFVFYSLPFSSFFYFLFCFCSIFTPYYYISCLNH